MMKKTNKLLAILCISLSATSMMSGCSALEEAEWYQNFKETKAFQVIDGAISKVSGLLGIERGEKITIAFTENFPANQTLNVSVDIAHYVECEMGTSLTLKVK